MSEPPTIEDVLAGMRGEAERIAAKDDEITRLQQDLNITAMERDVARDAAALAQGRIAELEADGQRVRGYGPKEFMAMKQDAARYRWCIKRISFAGFMSACFGDFHKPWDKSEADKTIDAAIEAEGGEK